MVRRNGSARSVPRGTPCNLIGKLILRPVAPESTDVTVALSSQGIYFHDNVITLPIRVFKPGRVYPDSGADLAETVK
ncbi:hypothetical protein Gorai_009779 [Gossypium raimondii]|uniref:Uncharacterized protein n=1 Tax=Gossypium raimondii TaxID=29730 RepID=A0A7J8PUD3_GOSRA|nr:hypothetical protein [Gossypium raimondii]